MYAHPRGVAVRASLASIADKSSTPTESETALLDKRISVAVDELKGMGWPIERIIVRLKKVANEVGFHPPRNRALTATELEHREGLWAHVIKESIEQYYRL